MINPTDFIMKHEKAIKILLFIGVFILIISLVSLMKIKSLEVNVIDKELNRRIDFCQDKTGYVLYVYTCEFISDCSPIYVDCDLVNKWELDYTYNANGRFNYDIMIEQFNEHQNSKRIKNVTIDYGLGFD